MTYVFIQINFSLFLSLSFYAAPSFADVKIVKSKLGATEALEFPDGTIHIMNPSMLVQDKFADFWAGASTGHVACGLLGKKFVDLMPGPALSNLVVGFSQVGGMVLHENTAEAPLKAIKVLTCR